MYKSEDRWKRGQIETIVSMRVLSKRRWELVEKKYVDGLTQDEHAELVHLSDYCWRHRWAINQ